MDAKRELFLQVLLRSETLRFGNFLTKSGRQSPYFFNTGNIATGEAVGIFADLLADLVVEWFPSATLLFGPAYKGIPLATATAMVMASRGKREIGFAYNRKEAKDHGEGGNLVGRRPGPLEKVVVVEDVLTGGTSLRESISMLRALGANLIGAVVGIDREEKGKSSLSARREMEEEFGLPVRTVLSISEIIRMLDGREFDGKNWLDSSQMNAIAAYRALYGAPT